MEAPPPRLINVLAYFQLSVPFYFLNDVDFSFLFLNTAI